MEMIGIINKTHHIEKKPSQHQKRFKKIQFTLGVAVPSLTKGLTHIFDERIKYRTLKYFRNQIQKCDARNFSTAVD